MCVNPFEMKNYISALVHEYPEIHGVAYQFLYLHNLLFVKNRRNM